REALLWDAVELLLDLGGGVHRGGGVGGGVVVRPAAGDQHDRHHDDDGGDHDPAELLEALATLGGLGGRALGGLALGTGLRPALLTTVLAHGSGGWRRSVNVASGV